MSDIVKVLGKRIRNYRTEAGLSQEKLAELSGCHPTYIGQIERGEKNATVESIERITTALKIPMSKLFEKLGRAMDVARHNRAVKSGKAEEKEQKISENADPVSVNEENEQ